MPTDKELADAYRLVLADNKSIVLTSVATRRIDELDPPKPNYADGTVAWVTDRTGYRWISVRSNGDWQSRSDAEHSGYVGIVKVEPLRVLADDEIAIKRIWQSSTAAEWRAEAKHAQSQDYPTHAAAGLCNAYADALDAEAGDRP